MPKALETGPYFFALTHLQYFFRAISGLQRRFEQVKSLQITKKQGFPLQATTNWSGKKPVKSRYFGRNFPVGVKNLCLFFI